MLEGRLTEAAAAVSGRLAGSDARFRGVFTDSRQPVPGGLFVALLGQRHDGHQFVAAALAAGAAGAVVSEPAALPAGATGIVVADTLLALGRLAAWHRKSFTGKVIAITGSVGKSTTRRLLASMLPLPVHEAPASYNNRVGVPLTLLSAPAAGYIVCEAGISVPGEMALLADILEPDVAVLTALGPAHLEGLGSIEAAASEKSQLLRRVRPGGLVVHGIEENKGTRKKGYKKTVDEGGLLARYLSDVAAEVVVPACFRTAVTLGAVGPEAEACFRIAARGREYEVCVPLCPTAGVELLRLSLEVAMRLGVDLADALAGLNGRFRPLPGRWNVQRLGRYVAINDAMNANPLSMSKSLSALALVPLSPRAALLGDMLELGDASERYHSEIGRLCARVGVDVLLCTGRFADIYIRAYREAGGKKAERVELPEQSFDHGIRGQAGLAPVRNYRRLARLLDEYLPAGGVLLVKASHALGLERLFEV